MDKPNKNKIQFKLNLGLIILKFILYFSLIMFTTGCAMVFFSLEGEKIIPASIFCLGILVLAFIVIARKYYNAGESEFDFEKGIISVKNLILQETIYPIDRLKSLTIESVVTQERVLMYNIYLDFEEDQVLIGQESDYLPLKNKIKSLVSRMDIELKEEERNVEVDKSSNFSKFIRMVAPMVVILIFTRLFVLDKFNLSPEFKFLIVIFISVGYFIVYYYIRNKRR